MRKYFCLFSLTIAGSFVAMDSFALPAPSSLDARERRAIAPRATPTPRPQTRTVVVPEGSRPSTTIVIDAGHGGFDRGGIPRQRVPESMMNLDVAQRLKAVLQAYGYRVVMTRDSDVFIPLGTRVAIANSYHDATFVCVHFNATARSSASGIETYFYSTQSLPLASAIHYYVDGGAPSADRRVRRRGCSVLRSTSTPRVRQDRHRRSTRNLPTPIRTRIPRRRARPRRKNPLELRRRINLESSVLSSAQMHAAEESAFARGVSVETLMDQAGAGVARAVRQFFPKPATCVVFAGKGHNGGDALVAAEQLQRTGWKIDIHLPFPEETCSELTQKKLKALRDAVPKSSDTIERAPQIIILDGLLGTGAKSFLREPLRTAAREINRLRREENAFVFAIDLPTGLDADSGENDPDDSVIADFTVTIGFAKHGLLVDSALNLVW